MAFGIDDAVAAASRLIDDGISKIWPDPAAKASAEATLIKTQSDAALGLLQAQMSVMLAEAKSDHWLAATWRPIVMLTFTALIVARWMGYSAPGLSEAEVLKLWDIVQLGLGGYVIGRTVEKVAPQIAAAMGRPS